MIWLKDKNENIHNDVQFCNTKNLDYELQNSYIIISKINNVLKRLSRLAILEELEYKNLINQFASQKARKINFKWNM